MKVHISFAEARPLALLLATPELPANRLQRRFWPFQDLWQAPAKGWRRIADKPGASIFCELAGHFVIDVLNKFHSGFGERIGLMATIKIRSFRVVGYAIAASSLSMTSSE